MLTILDAIPVKPGHPYLGNTPDAEGCVFEFSRTGPDLRLFFANITRQELLDVREGTVHLGFMAYRDLAIIPWQFGSSLSGDAQFHAGLYSADSAPAEPSADDRTPLSVKLILIELLTKTVLVARDVTLSLQLSKALRTIVARQLAHPISRQEYELQVDSFQRKFNAGPGEIARRAQLFEKV
jgi:hypothetical protein